MARTPGEIWRRNSSLFKVYHTTSERENTQDKRNPFWKLGSKSFCERAIVRQLCASPMKRSATIYLRASEVRRRVLYSVPNLYLLETVNQFPKRIHLGPRRIVWSLSDVLKWMQSKVDARTVGATRPKVVVGPEDRFIGRKEIRILVPYSVAHLRLLERAGNFPGRIRLGANRAAWLEREVRDWMEAHESRSRKESGDGVT